MTDQPPSGQSDPRNEDAHHRDEIATVQNFSEIELRAPAGLGGARARGTPADVKRLAAIVLASVLVLMAFGGFVSLVAVGESLWLAGAFAAVALGLSGIVYVVGIRGRSAG